VTQNFERSPFFSYAPLFGGCCRERRKYPGTVLSFVSCHNYGKSEKIGIDSIQDRMVEKWVCGGSTLKVTQWFDSVYLVVVKENNAGKITELRSIESLKPQKQHFQALKD